MVATLRDQCCFACLAFPCKCKIVEVPGKGIKEKSLHTAQHRSNRVLCVWYDLTVEGESFDNLLGVFFSSCQLSSGASRGIREMLPWPRMKAVLIGRSLKEIKTTNTCKFLSGSVDLFGFIGRRCKSSRRTVLLVDGDVHKIEEIKRATKSLEDTGDEVCTELFAPPGRMNNKKWRQFMEEAAVQFRPVPRSKDLSEEPNDQAIIAAIQEHSADNSFRCIALLTSDTGFCDTLKASTAVKSKPSFVVLVPEDRPMVADRYMDEGLEVMKVKSTKEEYGSCVRAILHADGFGSVELAERYQGFENRQSASEVMSFLEDLGYRENGEEEFLLPACAKFWLANNLGRLVVFPLQLSTISVHEVISSRKPSWVRYHQPCAFFLPQFYHGRVTESKRKTYGSALAFAIFRAGGPFMLQDSQQLTLQALKRLGYLDDNLNADEHEAMFCFINLAENKKCLRKMSLLPDRADRTQDVKEKLRLAFLSHASKGQWQIMKEGGPASKAVREILLAEGLLAKSHFGCSPTELLEPMKAYVKRHQLIPMSTFNGLACQINHHRHENPNKRVMSSFRRWRKFWRCEAKKVSVAKSSLWLFCLSGSCRVTTYN